MTKITITLTPAWQRANARAAEHAQAGAAAERLDCRTYRVKSASSDAVYTQVVTSVSRLDVTCDCPAGSHGRVCYHQSLAVSAAIRHIRAVEREREQQAAPVAERTPEQVAATAAMMRRFAA